MLDLLHPERAGRGSRLASNQPRTPARRSVIAGAAGNEGARRPIKPSHRASIRRHAPTRYRNVSAMPEQQPVGVVGLGLLGEALARRLLHAGFAVLGFDVDPAKTAKLDELGGRAASSIGAIGASCQTILIAVFSTEQVEAVLERDLLPAAGGGSGPIVLCASTCDPDRLARLEERAAAHGLRLLETPISGSSGQVARGEAV